MAITRPGGIEFSGTHELAVWSGLLFYCQPPLVANYSSAFNCAISKGPLPLLLGFLQEYLVYLNQQEGYGPEILIFLPEHASNTPGGHIWLRSRHCYFASRQAFLCIAY